MGRTNCGQSSIISRLVPRKKHFDEPPIFVQFAIEKPTIASPETGHLQQTLRPQL
ncbi:MAG: hypothetical protein IH991_00715 [Planctomycetes bacterium]|nr:hypothetical protein [Planctomycetota bacterium]